MSETSKTADSVTNSSSWIDMILQVFTDQEIKKMANITHPKIPGFSAKNITKAPAVLLRKKTVEHLKKNNNLEGWLRGLYKPMLDRYKEQDMTFDDFCHQAAMKDELTSAEALLLTGVLYPDSFNEMEDKIQENIGQDQFPLANLAVKKMTFKRELQLKSNVLEESNANELYETVLHSKFPDLTIDTLKDWIRDHKSFEIGELAYAASMKQIEWSKWTEGEKAAFLSLVFQDSQKLLVEIMEEIVKEKEEMQKDAKSAERKLKKLEKEKAALEETEESLKAKLRELESKLTQSEQQANTLQVEYDAIKRKSERTEREMQKAATNAPSPDFTLITEPEVVVITRLDKDAFKALIDDQQVIRIEGPGDLSADALHELNNRYIFIHSELFSTKEQFAMDAILKPAGLSYRYVGGDPIAAARKIIWYLEGEAVYETVERA